MNASQRALFGAIALWAAAWPVAATSAPLDHTFAAGTRTPSYASADAYADLAFFGGDPTFSAGAGAASSFHPGVQAFEPEDDARVTPVPEPQTGWLMLIGVGVLGLVLCRQG
ncbi:MAG TPA: PEP-CTERM sorting domain-containing protein [Albitalea sp.]|uniref:PEP-CTERM sorting domain-containing protein n=1 Tax=Piscinibacter sp. TaxID=1903157 RepID=UPI002ED27F36